ALGLTWSPAKGNGDEGKPVHGKADQRHAERATRTFPSQPEERRRCRSVHRRCVSKQRAPAPSLVAITSEEERFRAAAQGRVEFDRFACGQVEAHRRGGGLGVQLALEG